MNRIIMLGFAALSVFVLISNADSAADVSEEDVLLVGHRGAKRLADENTLKSYALAADYGMDFFETDPRLTRDGVFIIMHDKTVDRTTNGKGKVEDMTLAEIRRLRTENGERVPTLEEVFDLAKERGIKVYIDTKVRDISAMEKLLDVIVKKEMQDKVVMGLWRTVDQKWLHKNYPEVTSTLSWPVPAPSMKQIKELGADWVGMLVDQATPSRIKQARKLGLRVITMPINDPEKVKMKMKAGLDVIQTDDPRILQFIVEKRAESGMDNEAKGGD